MDAGSEGVEGELEDQEAEVVDVTDSTLVPESEGGIEKATFDDSRTYNGFRVNCTSTQKRIIEAADARARQILAIAGPANASARASRLSTRATSRPRCTR